MPAKKYSDEILNRAAEMREAGLSCGKIAEQLGMSVGAVSWHCLRLGADLPEDLQKARPNRKPIIVRRGNHVVRQYTPDEDEKILEMRANGERVFEIAAALGRKHNSIIGRLMTLARLQERSEGGS